MQNTHLKNISNLKIEIVLSLAMKYTLNRAQSTNYRLYKSLVYNILLYKLYSP